MKRSRSAGSGLRRNPVWAFIGYGLLIVFAVWAFFPVYWLFASSVKTTGALFQYPPSMYPESFSFRAYETIWSYSAFPVYFLNSVLVCLATTFISVAIAMFGGYSLTRYSSRGTRYLARMILFTYMFPSILLIIPLYYVVNSLGLLNTRIGLVMAYTTFNLPFSLWLLRSYFATIPHELDEAAIVDGASRWQALVRILLPVALPGLATTAIFTFVNSWNEFLYASVFISSDAKKTLPVAIQGMVSGELMDWGGLLASATLVTIPTVAFFFIIQKHIVSGLSAGAVKG